MLRAADRSGNRCRICFISLMEILSRVWQDEGQAEAWLAYEQCLSLPLMIVHEDALLLEKAAEVKATHHLSIADAWIAAAALLTEASGIPSF